MALQDEKQIPEVVDAKLLREAIQAKLKTTNVALPTLAVDEIKFDDGYWQVFVVPSGSDSINAADLAEMFAKVEEDVFENYGINTTMRLLRIGGTSPGSK